jgi:REP-associated tyrosine transposase
MPNHVHGIIVLVGAGRSAHPERGQPQGIAPAISLADVVHRFKTITTNRYIHGVKESGWPRFSGRFWQRNYYEHIIRNEEELARVREYVANNPLQWENDRENPSRSVGAGLKPARKIKSWEV